MVQVGAILGGKGDDRGMRRRPSASDTRCKVMGPSDEPFARRPAPSLDPIPLEIAMRKSIIIPGGRDQTEADQWLDLGRVARVEVTSEDPDHPIEAALLPGRGPGWRASSLGPQTIRLVFDEPRHVGRVSLRFVSDAAARTQEFVLRWVDAASERREAVRQQWNFSPGGSAEEVEDYRVDLPAVIELELLVTPDIAGGESYASLAELRVASPPELIRPEEGDCGQRSDSLVGRG